MKKLAKVAASLCLSFVLLVACMPAAAVHAEESFVPRYSTPGYDNPYYFSNMNLYYKYGYGMPNCTAYAYGRVYEILGHEPNLSRWNAGQWWFDNINYGWYSYGTTPQPGAVACWDKWDQNTGHVAVVEEVYGNGTVLISESSWSGEMFRTRVMNADGSGFMYGYRFLGYIYPVQSAGTGSGGSSSGHMEVEMGSRGSDVSELQQRLYELSYLNIAPDGVFGPMTHSAVIVFQKANGLVADGVAGAATWAKLYSEDVIAANSTGTGDGADEPADDPSDEPSDGETSGGEPSDGQDPADDPDVNGSSEGNQTIDPAQMPNLYLWDMNSAVTVLQNLLNEKGYNAGTADGDFGMQTYNAVKAFQKANGLVVDGMVGAQTWAVLCGDSADAPVDQTPDEPVDNTDPGTIDPAAMPALYQGNVNNSVKVLQRLLNEKGYNAGVEDGIFGGGTYSARIAFQKANGLVVDGMVGYQTWSALCGDSVSAGEAPEEETTTPEEPQGPSDEESSNGSSSNEQGSGSAEFDPSAMPVLQLWDMNDAVATLQKTLNAKGYDAGVVDGDFGMATYTAVRNFQKANGLPVDGWVGQMTWQALAG